MLGKINSKKFEVSDVDQNEKLILPPLDKIKKKEKSAQVITSPPAAKEKKPKQDAVTKMEKSENLLTVPDVFVN